MRFAEAIDQYIADQWISGRISSAATEVAYRAVLERHRDDVQNRDPSLTGRDDVKRTLARWKHPNTQAGRRSILVSFYDWCGEEGIRDTNPARLTRRPKRRPAQVYRLTHSEAAAMLDACETTFERRAVHLGICGGIRSRELRGLQGLHFERPGWIWISADIGKGGKERWIPVTVDLEPIVDEIIATVAPAHFVLPGQAEYGGAHGTPKIRRVFLERGCSSQLLQRTVAKIAKRAGIAAHIHPHLMRHAYAQHVVRHAGVQITRAVMGHSDLRTTQAYLDSPLLDEIAAGMRGITFRSYPLKNPRFAQRGEGGIRTLGNPLDDTQRAGLEQNPEAQP